VGSPTLVLGIEEPTPVLEQTNGDPRRGARALRRISASPSAGGGCEPVWAQVILSFRRGRNPSSGGCACRKLDVRFQLAGEAAKARDHEAGSRTTSGSRGAQSPGSLRKRSQRDEWHDAVGRQGAFR
jgi:hypothetical protein